MIKAMPWALAMSLLVAICLFVLLLNAGGGIDDSRSQAALLRDRNQLALSIVRKDWIGKDASSVAELATEFQRQGVISKKATDGSFEIGDLTFEIRDGVVSQVTYFD